MEYIMSAQNMLPIFVSNAVNNLGWSIIPVGIDKKPYFPWKKYQQEKASLEQVEQWQERYNPAGWAVITGSISNLIILDWDGESGRNTFDGLGLNPHVLTGSGGYHSYFAHPGWHVPTLNSKSKVEMGQRWPGLDIRADGGYAIFCGRNRTGEYSWLRPFGELDELSLVPDSLRDFLGLLHAPQARRSIADICLDKYLGEASVRGRDNACFDLACQLRDNGYTQIEAETYCAEFSRRTHGTNMKGQHEPFTDEDAQAKVASAYTSGARSPWEQKNGPSIVAPQRFNLTDLGNAERFASKCSDRVRWCEVWNTWMIFNGKSWEPDRSGRVDQMAKSVVRRIYNEAASEPDEMERKRIAKHAAASESNRSVRAMLDRAKSELPVLPEEFNTHLYLINCDNGTLDLRSGELHPHSHQDMLTRCLKIKYNPLAICRKWENFIDGIFASDQGLISFMQQALGMSLCGDTSEQCLFICHGTGSNGKTTMLETVRIIMASYALAANIETFQMKKHEGIGNDVAELYGARFVTASENALGSRLNEAFIKKATGKEPLRARRLHENEFEFMPEFSIWFAVNHKPVVNDTSKGMWRRVHFIPFNVTIEGDKLDKHLGEKLLEESEGILAWLVQGCMQWYKQGKLVQPQAVKEATQKYQNEMDVVAKFLDECCTHQVNAETGATRLYLAYKKWCEETGERYEKQTAFGLQLAEKGYKKEKTRSGVVYLGVGLLESVNSVNSCEQFPQNSYANENTPQKTSENYAQPFTPFTPDEKTDTAEYSSDANPSPQTFQPGDRVLTPEGPATVRFELDGRYCVHLDNYDPKVGCSRGFSPHELALAYAEQMQVAV
jgi:P4 family phage/plasmid primase-like protien